MHKQSCHRTGRSHKCSFCERSFNHIGNLSYHVKICRHRIPFKCRLCGKSYKYKKDLNRHAKHVHDEQNGYRCKLCNKFYSCNDDLNHHIRSCGAATPSFKCSLCDKSFRLRSDLEGHNKFYHSGDDMYKCKLCEKVFLCKEYSKRHHCESRRTTTTASEPEYNMYDTDANTSIMFVWNNAERTGLGLNIQLDNGE